MGEPLSSINKARGCSFSGRALPSLLKFNPQYYTHAAKMKKRRLCVEYSRCLILSKATPLLKPPLLGEPGLGVLRKRSSWSSLLPVNSTMFYKMKGAQLFSTADPTQSPSPGLPNNLKSRELMLLAPSLLCLPSHLLFRLVSVSLAVAYLE